MSWWDDLYRQSFAGSYQDAAQRRALLQDKNYLEKNDIDPENVEAYDDALRAQQGQAIAGGIITGLTGATTLLSNAAKDAQIRDTSMQEGIISDLNRAGNYNYNNYDQLANDYAQTNFNPQFGYQDIRGMTVGQQIGSVGTSALTGAATGLQIGGVPGAIIGGVVGLGTGLGGVLEGNNSAHVRQNSLNLQAGLASDNAQMNFAAAHERIGDNIHRQNAVNAVARGGQIRRFADNALLKVPKQAEHHNNGGKVIKTRVEGGLKVRFKK